MGRKLKAKTIRKEEGRNNETVDNSWGGNDDVGGRVHGWPGGTGTVSENL
jgi:hypothetical protein